MDGKVIELGRFCRHGHVVSGCQVCHGEFRIRELSADLESANNQITALNQQNLNMWYTLQEIAKNGDPTARDTLDQLAKGTTFRGTLA